MQRRVAPSSMRRQLRSGRKSRTGPSTPRNAFSPSNMLLAVVQHRRGGIQRQRPVGHDPGIVPAAPPSYSTRSMWSVKVRPNTSSVSLGRGFRCVVR